MSPILSDKRMQSSQFTLLNACQQQTQTAIEYLLDQDNVIITIVGPWQDFAEGNGGKQLSIDAVIGQPLLHFISGKVTKQCWLDVFCRVREQQRPVSIEYRCDAPDLKRFMCMRIVPEQQGQLRLINQLLRQEPVAKVIKIQCAPQRTKHSCMRCSICNRISQAGAWQEADEHKYNPQQASLFVTYGVCPDCKDMLTG